MNGFVGKIIRVNLTDESIKIDSLNVEHAKLYIGGRGLGEKLFIDEVDPKMDAFSNENKLIFMTGPLTGTLAASGGRYEVISKSPLTGMMEAYSMGGHFGPELKYAGYDGIILEGKAKKPLYLYIDDDRIELRDASHLWGNNVSETTDTLLAETDVNAKIACIGPAGENLVLFANIINDKNKVAGRSGLGAVMGFKNLKAIAIKGTQSIQVAKTKKFIDACTAARKKIKDETFTGIKLPAYGTQVLLNSLNSLGALPSKNFKESSFDKAESISGETLTKKYLVRNKSCMGCSIGCNRIIKIDKSSFGGGPEFEAGWAFGSNCGIDNLESICEANLLCNEFGIDPISMGGSLACAMELFEMGYVTKEDLGSDLPFGDAEEVVKLIKMTGKREGFGDKLALGSYRMAEEFGHPELSMSVKKLELPGYDARAIQGIGLHYATSHYGDYMTSVKIFEDDYQGTDGKAIAVKTFQDLTALVDSVGICLLSTYAIGLSDIAEMFRNCTGIDYTDEEILKVGERICNMEKIFNLKNGFTKKDDTLPTRLLEEPITEGTLKGKVSELSKMLSEYYSLRGWNEEGVPTEEKKKELSIE